MVQGFVVRVVMKSTAKEILDINLLPMIVCTNSQWLYDCLMKLGSTQEKRLMVNLMCLQQSYNWRKIIEIRWIDGNSNLADAMTKSKPYAALQELIDSKTISLNTAGWVERADGTQV